MCYNQKYISTTLYVTTNRISSPFSHKSWQRKKAGKHRTRVLEVSASEALFLCPGGRGFIPLSINARPNPLRILVWHARWSRFFHWFFGRFLVYWWTLSKSMWHFLYKRKMKNWRGNEKAKREKRRKTALLPESFRAGSPLKNGGKRKEEEGKKKEIRGKNTDASTVRISGTIGPFSDGWAQLMWLTHVD